MRTGKIHRHEAPTPTLNHGGSTSLDGRSCYRRCAAQMLGINALQTRLPGLLQTGLDPTKSPPSHRIPFRRTPEDGATMPEYLIVVIMFVGIAIAATFSIGQLSQGFHNQMTGGFDQAYPTNFIPPPTPSPTPIT